MLVRTDITQWPHLPATALLDELAHVVSELFGLYQELSISEVEERREKVQTHQRSDQETVTGRDREAASAALAATLSVIELKGQIAALETLRDFGMMLVTRGL